MNKSVGLTILFTLFLGTPLKDGGNLFYDFPTFFFYLRTVKKKEVPQDGKLMGIYGEFLWKQELIDLLEAEFMNTDADDYHKFVKRFRRLCIKKIVSYIDPEYGTIEADTTNDIITNEDISEFLMLVSKNRIWKDSILRQQEPIIRELANYVSFKNFNVLEEELDFSKIQSSDIFSNIDFLNPEISRSKAYETLEKENWKKYVQPEFHAFVDGIDLTNLKELLQDQLGRKFTPLGWQGKFILNHRRFNYIAASRRAGKTFLGAGYLAGRQLLLPMQTVVYIVPTLKNHARPAWRALSNYFSKFKDFKMNKSDFSIINEATGSEMYFITAERNDSVRGNAANLLIVDEAAFIDEQIYETASALIRTTNGMVYCISTVNPDSPKNRFYYKLIDGEIAMHDANAKKYGLRVDLYANPFIPEEERLDIIEEGKKNPDLFAAEWMATFTDKDNFNLSKFRVIDQEPVELMIEGRWNTRWRAEALSKEVKPYYYQYIISYDGAKRKDKPGLTVRGLRPGGMDLVMAEYMTGYEYRDQVDFIDYIYKMLGGQKKVEILIDYGGAGIAVEEIFRKNKNLFVTCIQALGGVYEDNEGGLWKVGKDLMKNKMKAALDLGTVRGFSFMSELRIEFETYTDDGKRNSSLDNHRDLISASYHCIRFAERMGYLDKPEAETVEEQRWNGEYEQYDTPQLDFQIQGPKEYERISKFGY